MQQQTKAFSVRLPKEIWMFLKRQSIDKEIPMAQLISSCLEKYKKKCEKDVDCK